MGKTEDELQSAVLTGEMQLPEAPASINVKIAWNGGDVMLTLRGFDEQEVLKRLVAIVPALDELGMKIAKRSAPAKAKPKAKGTPKRTEPDVIDETTIEITSIYIKEGKKGNYAWVKGTPGYEKDGAICFDDAWQNSGYDLQEKESGKFYEPADFGFVRAVIRFVDGKPRVWRLLTEREQIPF